MYYLMEQLSHDQWRSPSWAEVGHDPPRKIKKLMIIGILCEILNNFATALVFDRSKFALMGLVAHMEKKVKNHGSILRVLNNFSTV